ncbi:MAG: 30S ribosomal protein S6 [Candidatus Wildermuthbacteria bacterium]|nr:30S ribosomal protein S6 [Candidatus Wildermuthbacteria bacterium]
MKDYELTLISQTNLPEEAFQGLLQALSSWIQSKEGIVEKQDSRRNIPLLSPIQKHPTGNMVVLKFKMNEEAAPELEKRVKEEKSVLRSMLTKFRKPKAQRVPTFRKQAQAAPLTEPKLSPEEIDKELEQIFKEPNK